MKKKTESVKGYTRKGKHGNIVKRFKRKPRPKKKKLKPATKDYDVVYYHHNGKLIAKRRYKNG